jgi:hypothetical protein
MERHWYVDITMTTTVNSLIGNVDIITSRIGNFSSRYDAMQRLITEACEEFIRFADYCDISPGITTEEILKMLNSPTQNSPSQNSPSQNSPSQNSPSQNSCMDFVKRIDFFDDKDSSSALLTLSNDNVSVTIDINGVDHIVYSYKVSEDKN